MFMAYRLFPHVTRLKYNFDQRETAIATNSGGLYQ